MTACLIRRRAQILSPMQIRYLLQWRHNGRDGVSNHQPHECLLSRLFNAQIKENIKAMRHSPCVRGIQRWSLNSPHKEPVPREMFPFDDVIMKSGTYCRTLDYYYYAYSYSILRKGTLSDSIPSQWIIHDLFWQHAHNWCPLYLDSDKACQQLWVSYFPLEYLFACQNQTLCSHNISTIVTLVLDNHHLSY